MPKTKRVPGTMLSRKHSTVIEREQMNKAKRDKQKNRLLIIENKVVVARGEVDEEMDKTGEGD